MKPATALPILRKFDTPTVRLSDAYFLRSIPMPPELVAETLGLSQEVVRDHLSRADRIVAWAAKLSEKQRLAVLGLER